MKGLFIPEITAEMFRNGCLESIEALMDEGEIYDIDYEPEHKTGKWIVYYECPKCGEITKDFTECCPFCGAKMAGRE